jgi:hypothetical protein
VAVGLTNYPVIQASRNLMKEENQSTSTMVLEEEHDDVIFLNWYLAIACAHLVVINALLDADPFPIFIRTLKCT